MVQRLTFRRRHSYNSPSNKTRRVRTPGNRVVMQYRKKCGKGVRCGDCGRVLPGIPHVRAAELHRLTKARKTVSRVYGGNKCAACVRTRILRAFLLEEQKIVKRVVKQQAKAAK